jgi:hypothetical protein
MHGRISHETYACLDGGAETDTINERFAISQGFKRMGNADIKLERFDGKPGNSYSRWEVTFSLTDYRG